MIFKNQMIKKMALTLFFLLGVTSTVAERKSSREAHNVYGALIEHFISRDICKNHQSCSDLLQLYTDVGDQIKFTMYGQKERKISAIVGQFLIENGLKFSNGKPIKLKIYELSKSEHLSLFVSLKSSDLIAELEIKK